MFQVFKSFAQSQFKCNLEISCIEQSKDRINWFAKFCMKKEFKIDSQEI